VQLDINQEHWIIQGCRFSEGVNACSNPSRGAKIFSAECERVFHESCGFIEFWGGRLMKSE
jgi:hypothetical protein